MGDNIWNELLEKYAPTAYAICKEDKAVLSVQHTYSVDCYTNTSWLHKEEFGLFFTYLDDNDDFERVFVENNNRENALRELEDKLQHRLIQKRNKL